MIEKSKKYSISLKDFMNKYNQKSMKSTLHGLPVNISYFELSGEIVWGATSMILVEFKQILEKI